MAERSQPEPGQGLLDEALGLTESVPAGVGPRPAPSSIRPPRRSSAAPSEIESR